MSKRSELNDDDEGDIQSIHMPYAGRGDGGFRDGGTRKRVAERMDVLGWTHSGTVSAHIYRYYL